MPKPDPDLNLKDLEIAYLRDIIDEAAQACRRAFTEARHNRPLADLAMDVVRILNGRPA